MRQSAPLQKLVVAPCKLLIRKGLDFGPAIDSVVLDIQ